MPAFYEASIAFQNNSCAMTLLLLLRNQLASHEAVGFSSDAVYNAFVNPGNQLQLLQNSEHVLNWRPQIADDAKNEVFPAVLEMETSPFRHGPPGCEDVIRCLFGRLGSGVLGEMIRVLKNEQVAVCGESENQDVSLVEADLYVLGQFIEEMRSNRDDYPIVPALQPSEG